MQPESSPTDVSRAAAPTAPTTTAAPTPAGATPSRLGGTRTASTWAALATGLFFLIVVLVFILQNLRDVRAHFFWATWTIPLAVDLLLAAVLGALVMFTAGSLRILQLRRTARSASPRRGRHRT